MERTGSVKNKIVASDLLAERAKCDFNQEELRILINGGSLNYSLLKKHYERFGANPGTRNHLTWYELTPEEKQEDLWKRINVIYKEHGKEYFKDYELLEYPYTQWVGYFQGLLPGVGLHIQMFWLSVVNLASEEQKARWMPEMRQLNMLGCYAQTEIGHGSNVAGLETTATLDLATDEFVIHTPRTSSAKYWPGDLGRMTSHAVVFARLKIRDTDYGVMPFMVNLRDTNTWKHRPGVTTGDLGPKVGYESKDNGWAIFNQVRIPRTDMLMGLVNVDKEGEISFKGDPRVLYSVMMYTRMLIIGGSGYFSMMATCIGLRYASVRRQFSTQVGNNEERTILNYQTHQHVYGPLLASGIAMQIVSTWVIDEFRAMMDDIKTQNFERMDPMHHILSGFKSFFSDSVMKNIDTARRNCGGAGFSSNSGFTEIQSLTSPFPTYEGDNVVMYGSSTRYLVKLWKKVKDNQFVPFPFTYLNMIKETIHIKNRA